MSASAISCKHNLKGHIRLPIDSTLSEWAHKHYRANLFNAGETIRVRPGLLYFVEQGTVRLESRSDDSLEDSPETPGRTFLGFVGTSRPFEIAEHSPFVIKAYAHTPNTCVFWLYWHELDSWQDLEQQILNEFRYQHQRQLIHLSVLTQKRTIDRLVGFLTLLAQEFGIPCERGQYLPFGLTHTQIGSAIGATRVTVNRLMKDLHSNGLICTANNSLLILDEVQTHQIRAS